MGGGCTASSDSDVNEMYLTHPSWKIQIDISAFSFVVYYRGCDLTRFLVICGDLDRFVSTSTVVTATSMPRGMPVTPVILAAFRVEPVVPEPYTAAAAVKPVASVVTIHRVL